MTLATAFPEITRTDVPLAPFTQLRIGGPAQYLLEPRDSAELARVLARCQAEKIPVRMLGGGHNLLVRDEPIPGAVLRLTAAPFTWVEGTGPTVRAAGGANLHDLVAHTVRSGLTGLEGFVGIRGTVGGSVRCNAGDRSGEIASAVHRVAVLTESGSEQIRGREELQFGDHTSDLDEPVILWVEFRLDSDAPEAVLKRMRKAWILRKQHEPFSFQPSVRMFRNPPGQTAPALIEQARLAKLRVGGAEVSERNGNYAVAHPGTTARDLLRLLDTVRQRVRETTGVQLEQELNVW
jgi:UDP-N-acetylmuramate dehydrogenase